MGHGMFFRILKQRRNAVKKNLCTDKCHLSTTVGTRRQRWAFTRQERALWGLGSDGSLRGDDRKLGL